MIPQPDERVLFLTGRLAENLVRRQVEVISQQFQFVGRVQVLGISVAALMHSNWLMGKLTDEPHGFDRVYLPGWCQGDIAQLSHRFGIPFHLGPKDILDLGEFFGQASRPQPPLDDYDIEIIAEVNHAPRLTERDIFEMAERFRQSGADVIDVGCIPGECWGRVGVVVRQLTQAGFRVSIDSFDRQEVETAIDAGAELVLSCQSKNVDWLSQCGVEVVVIPDEPTRLETLWDTAEQLRQCGCRFRLDPILEPIGFGFAQSLSRYFEVRRQSPQVAMMMGIGNLTELTEVDSGGLNALLAAICQDLRIQSVLTTEVIPWCRTAVREFDLARRLMKHAIDQRTLPKRVHSDLVVLRDPQVAAFGQEVLDQFASDLRDANYRIFVEADEIHVMNRNGYWRGQDAFELFDQFIQSDPTMETGHAFYLGYELAKAVTALTLGKQYRQDQSLRWGFLTVPERSAHERRRKGNSHG